MENKMGQEKQGWGICPLADTCKYAAIQQHPSHGEISLHLYYIFKVTAQTQIEPYFISYLFMFIIQKCTLGYKLLNLKPGFLNLWNITK